MVRHQSVDPAQRGVPEGLTSLATKDAVNLVTASEKGEPQFSWPFVNVGHKTKMTTFRLVQKGS